MRQLFLAFTLLFSFAAPAAEFEAGERIGEFFIQDIILRPTFFSRESEGGEFSLGESLIRFSWRRDQKLSTQFALGSLTERPIPRYYDAQDTVDTIGVVEAFMEYQGVYGRMRMGVMPLNFGYEGYLPNASLNFNRSQLYLNRYIIFRDFGLSIYSEFNGFYTEVIAHNGEGGATNQDGKIWLTPRWGWTNDRELRVQVSGQAGYTGPEATATNGASGFMGFDNNKGALWRFGAFTVHYFPKNWDIVLQANYGELEQGGARGSFSGEQLDLFHFFKNGWGLGFRYDNLDPNRNVSDDAITNSSLAIVYGDKGATSRVYLITTKRVEEGTDISSDELRFIWRVTPYF
jgi:hypothetical protein